MLSAIQKAEKRLFDVILAVVGIVLTWWLVLLAWIIASLEIKGNGLFVQKRIGRDGKPFWVLKIKTMKEIDGYHTSITTSDDRRISRSGMFFRKTKIDELPQLFNVLFGQMSFVGPRPDVSGYADKLMGEDRIILSLRPGITGPASLKYKNEEEILASQEDPQQYNDEIIWPDKVRINREYVRRWSLKNDILIIKKTIFG